MDAKKRGYHLLEPANIGFNSKAFGKLLVVQTSYSLLGLCIGCHIISSDSTNINLITIAEREVAPGTCRASGDCGGRAGVPGSR